MDNSGSFAQTDALAPLFDIAVKPEAGLDLANPAKLVEKQSPQTRADFLRGLRQVERFVAVLGGAQLRAYQQQVAKAVVDSVLAQCGLSLVVMFPRQSGKNFLQAQLEVYFLVRFARVGAEMIKFSPTFEPQSLNAMRRLEAALQANWLTRDAWKKSSGNHYRFGNAHLTFLSAAPGANVVGATASTLLELDEAQDIESDKYDKQIAPMAASTNATRVFWGTAWTEQTLLARELRLAEEAQARDGIRRVFRLSADVIRQEVPAYGAFVDEQVARLGRTHPMVRSQYFSEEISTEGGLFPPARLELMKGSHPAQELPEPGKLYALLVDLAGEDEAMRQGTPNGLVQAEALVNPGRDATAITVVEVDLHLQSDELVGKPIYKVMQRYLWTGEKHSTQYARLLALVERWQPQCIVVDASGVGAGVASFLADRFGERVVQLRFTQQVKSRLGWGFLAVIDTGRFQDYLPDKEQSEAARLQALFQRQLAAVSYSVSSGPEYFIAWGVPEAARDPQGGGWLHDDLVLSAAMVAMLDEQPWSVSSGAPLMIAAPDPIKEMDGGF
ncbi:MAG TPA: hypothetical protein PLX92_04910 [Anaerolineaceae bacterium]|nr:hypothetical protein [Anaerolineaceae bacterium]HUM49529.1 hypothetical protein [Anaerolineaceae bacterium]